MIRRTISKLFPKAATTATRAIAAPYPMVELFHWEPKDGSRNFGDHLSKIVVSGVGMMRGVTLDDEVRTARRLLGIGSILHFANDGDVIWGSGINGKVASGDIPARQLDIRAVRGPKTAARLRDMGMSVPDVFGDPALLVPRLFKDRFIPTPNRDYVIVPNLHDLPLVTDQTRLVSPLWGWNRCIEEILSAKFVIASSLHGLILAEAFGVPARYLRLSETESTFKYDDYAQGTGRASLDPVRSVEEALGEGPHPAINFDADALIAAFPFDLWQR